MKNRYWKIFFSLFKSEPEKSAENMPGKTKEPQKEKFYIEKAELWQKNIDRIQMLIIEIGKLPDGNNEQQMQIQVKLRERLLRAIKNYHHYLNSCE